MPRPPIETRDPACTSVPGAARFLGLAEGHVRKLADAGEIPHSRAANGARVFKFRDLQRYALKRASVVLQRERRR
jgi:hypothetical protein